LAWLAVQSPALQATEFKQKALLDMVAAGLQNLETAKRLGVIDDYYLQIDQAVQVLIALLSPHLLRLLKAFRIA